MVVWDVKSVTQRNVTYITNYTSSYTTYLGVDERQDVHMEYRIAAVRPPTLPANHLIHAWPRSLVNYRVSLAHHATTHAASHAATVRY